MEGFDGGTEAVGDGAGGGEDAKEELNEIL